MAKYATTALKLSDTYVNTLPYNTCSTAAGTAAKTVSAGEFALETGAMVVVKFTVTNTAANPTLNVSSTGAKAIYYNGAAITAGYLKANKVYQFIYNGTQWDLVGDVDTNTTYTFNGAVSTIKDSNLTASRALISNSSGKVAVSDITSTELGYLDGVTSAIQTQLNGKAPLSHDHAASDITSGTIAAARLPEASSTSAGITIVWPAAQCTTFTSDSGTVTPLAVQKAVLMFAPKICCYSGTMSAASSNVHTLTINDLLPNETTMLIAVTTEFLGSYTSGNTIKVTGKYYSGGTSEQSFTTDAVALKDLKGNNAPTNAFTAGSLNQIMLKLTRSGTTVTIAKAYINSAVATWN